MPVFRKLFTAVSVGVLGVFAIYVVSTPFLREPPTPVVHVTVEPQPLSEDQQSSGDRDEPTEEPTDETTEEGGTNTSPAFQTGERTGEKLSELWTDTKDFGRGLWSVLGR